MPTCGDCLYLYNDPITDKWKCTKSFGTKDISMNACSQFASENNKNCCDCTYLEFTTFSSKCSLTGKKISNPSHVVACSRYVED